MAGVILKQVKQKMKAEEKHSLMLVMGAIHDISEKSKEKYTKNQLAEIHNKMLSVLNLSNDFNPMEVLEEDSFCLYR